MQTICHYKYALWDAMLLAMMASLYYITDLNIDWNINFVHVVNYLKVQKYNTS